MVVLTVYIYNDEKEFPKRKNTRLKNYDYSTPGYYYITICTNEKKCIFWSDNKCNKLGIIADHAVSLISEHLPGVRVDKYVIMPNHVHMILILENNETNLSVAVGQYKSYVSKAVHKIVPDLNVWQSSFHDHKIRNQVQYEKIWNYIEFNPLKWNMDCFYSE